MFVTVVCLFATPYTQYTAYIREYRPPPDPNHGKVGVVGKYGTRYGTHRVHM